MGTKIIKVERVDEKYIKDNLMKKQNTDDEKLLSMNIWEIFDKGVEEGKAQQNFDKLKLEQAELEVQRLWEIIKTKNKELDQQKKDDDKEIETLQKAFNQLWEKETNLRNELSKQKKEDIKIIDKFTDDKLLNKLGLIGIMNELKKQLEKKQ